MKTPTFTLCVFTWNEIESIQVIMPQVDRTLFNQILVIDANSKDGTAEWCKKNGYEVLSQTTNGLRQAYQEALPLIRSDYMIAFSPDGNSMASKLPELINKLKEGYDMVIVSRYFDGAKSEDDDALTGFGNWMFTRLINVLHKGSYTDGLVMYRGFRTELMRQLKLDTPDDPVIKAGEKLFAAHGMGTEPLMTARASRIGLKVGEIGGDEPPRIGGVRKLQPFRYGAAILFQIVMEFFIPSGKYRKQQAA